VTKRLLEDFPGISQTEFANINLWATLVGSLFCLPCGWLIDRVGTRHIVGGVVLVLAGVVAWMSMLRDETSLAIAIMLSRGIGQSMLSVVSITMIGKWFQRNIDVAMGVYAVLMSLLMAVGTGLAGHRVTVVGWRGAWMEIAWALFIATPVLWLLTRNGPRDLMREFAPRTADAHNKPLIASATWRQALTTPCFWIFAGSISLFGMVSSGVSLFQQFILEERGLSEQVFHACLVIGLLTGMVANLASGGLARIVRLQWLLAVAMLLFAGATFALPLLRTTGQAYTFAVINGIAGGTITVLFFAVWGHAYGPAQLGMIQGAAQMMTVVASALGPLVVARSHEISGSYQPVLVAFSLAAAGFAVAALFSPVPNASHGEWGGERNVNDKVQVTNA
jgi:cyanate permease